MFGKRCVITATSDLFVILSDDGSFPYKTKYEQRHRVSFTECFTEADLKSLSELNPPALMQNGNVGTPVKVFLQLIQSCRLPPRLIRKLGLTFPKTSSNRRYGNVPFQYQDSWTLPAIEETVLTAAGHEISGPGAFAAPPSGRRKLADHTETTETDEPQKEEEDDAQSDADDVGLNPFTVISMSSINAFSVLASVGCPSQPIPSLCCLLIIHLVGCRMMTAVRSGSATRLCMKM